MTKGQVTQAVNPVDLMWDGWLNNLRAVQNFQEDVQQKTLQAFSYQKELLDSSVKTLSQMEEASKKVAKDWNDKVQSNVKQSGIGQGEQLSELLNSVQDITEKVQSLSWNPSHTLLNVFIESQNQLEATLKKALASQQKDRTETFKKIEELTEQMKAAQKGLLNPIKA